MAAIAKAFENILSENYTFAYKICIVQIFWSITYCTFSLLFVSLCKYYLIFYITVSNLTMGIINKKF